MAFVAIPHLEEAVAFKCRLWLNDFLGVAERQDPDPAVAPGCTSRPVEYIRAADILDVNVKQTPALAVGLRGVRDMRWQGAELWATALVEVAVRFGSSGTTSFDVGVGPRIYLSALLNMFTQPACMDLGAGVRLSGMPEDAGLSDPPMGSGDRFAVCSVTLPIDAPLADRAQLFFDAPASVPAPGDPPREPDEPQTILTLITSVEAMT